MNKCDWMANFALFSQFVTCLGRIVHQPTRKQTYWAVIVWSFELELRSSALPFGRVAGHNRLRAKS